MIRLAIADDHRMVRDGLRRIVEAHPDMEITVEAAGGPELLAGLAEGPADVLLLDISMPGTEFLDLMETLRARFPDLAILVVSMHAEKHWAVQSLKAGAAGYLSKNHSAEELAEGIRRVHQGGRYVTPELTEALARTLSGEGAPNLAEQLSPREFQVLRGLGAGKMVKTVARELGLSRKTVSTYRARILEKLELSSTSDLVRFAVEHDLID